MSDLSTNNINSYNAAAASSSAASSSSDNSSGVAKKSNMASMDTFLQLLSKEMQNQDVMNPTSNTEYITQLSQFTSLQALQSLVSTAQVQSGTLIAQTSAELIGKSVHVAAYDEKAQKVLEDSGIVTKCDYSTGSPTITVNGKTYAMSSVMEIENDPTSNSFQYGASLVGKTVTVSTTDADGKATDVSGAVTGCVYQSGDVAIVLNGKSYSLSAVTKVTAGTAASDSSTNAGNPDTKT